MKIKHIFFDLDHTLWDFDKNSAFAFEKAFEDFNLKCDLDGFLKTYHPINEGYWSLYAKGEVTKEILKYRRFRDTFELLNFDISDDHIAQLSEYYMQVLPTFNHLHEGAKDVLDYLHPKHELHIITNGFNEVSYGKLTNSGIIDYFKKIITSENAGAKKPDAQAFHYALNEAKALPSESLMIGDNYEADVLGARAVGMQAVHFDYRDENKEAQNKRITNLRELIGSI
jgi:putative hydrolase of the HAD superfamily